MYSIKTVPPELESYLVNSFKSSLTLITSVLGATSNWLVLRLLYQTLVLNESEPVEPTTVLLLSFLQDGQFWQEAALRLGLDLVRMQKGKKYNFIDGLSALFLNGSKSKESLLCQTLCKPDLVHILEKILAAIKAIKGDEERNLLLIIDGIDFLLAASDEINPVALEEMILGLREEVHTTVTTLSADLPLVARSQTPLERDHAAFLLSIAHQSNLVMSLRTLETGAARDVSGVLRVTSSEIDKRQRNLQDKEFLYFVDGDSRVKLFERGQR